MDKIKAELLKAGEHIAGFTDNMDMTTLAAAVGSTSLAADLAETIQIATKAGIAEDKIILDPGVGFGKTYENNLEVINRLDALKVFGYPILLGASRKSVIGLTLDLPVSERLTGTLVTTVIAVLRGCMSVRVHDVKENVQAIKMAEAILGR